MVDARALVLERLGVAHLADRRLRSRATPAGASPGTRTCLPGRRGACVHGHHVVGGSYARARRGRSAGRRPPCRSPRQRAGARRSRRGARDAGVEHVGGDDAVDQPPVGAVAASIGPPVSSISSARLRPTARDSGTIGVVQNRPIFTPGVAKRALLGGDGEVARGDELAARRGGQAVHAARSPAAVSAGASASARCRVEQRR